MCLTIDVPVGGTTPKPLIAKKDIVAYKVIYKDGSSVYQGFEYKPNRTYKIRRKLKAVRRSTRYEVYEGFHAFKYKKDAESDPNAYADDDSYTDAKIIKVVIPAGTEYFVGSYTGTVNYVARSIRTGEL